jgi:hypothetical protein
MTTLKVGIASYGEMKARTMEPKVWFTSTESFAKVLSAGNRELLRVIAEEAPGSLDELARMAGKAKSNLSRTRGRWKAAAWSASSVASGSRDGGHGRPILRLCHAYPPRFLRREPTAHRSFQAASRAVR